jgi:putative Mg2+ transporter-C (MgtC) family protein
MQLDPGDLTKLLVSLLVGGIIGFEREARAKTAGLRTITLITVGATLFTMLSFKFTPTGDASRTAANIVIGIGFLGAGAIILSDGRVTGLTTAASIWVAAALGMAAGLGEFGLVAVSTGLVIVVLWLLAHFDRLIDVVGREVRTYVITFSGRDGKTEQIEQRIAASRLKIVHRRRKKLDSDRLHAEWEVSGPLAQHAKFVDAMLEDSEILELRY